MQNERQKIYITLELNEGIDVLGRYVPDIEYLSAKKLREQIPEFFALLKKFSNLPQVDLVTIGSEQEIERFIEAEKFCRMVRSRA